MAVLTDPSAPPFELISLTICFEAAWSSDGCLQQWSKEPEQPIVTCALRCHTGEKEMTYEDSKALVLEDLEHCGVKVRQILNEASWYYFLTSSEGLCRGLV